MTSHKVCNVRRDKTFNLRRQFAPYFSRSSGPPLLFSIKMAIASRAFVEGKANTRASGGARLVVGQFDVEAALRRHLAIPLGAGSPLQHQIDPLPQGSLSCLLFTLGVTIAAGVSSN
jgi:hypothetical protein